MPMFARSYTGDWNAPRQREQAAIGMNVPAELTSPALLDELTLLASQAAAAIMRVRAGGASARRKADASPVTAADEAAEEIILAGLSRLLPGIDIVSEESAPDFKGLAAQPGKAPTPPVTFILVDPLDGTREFVDGRDEFTVNVAVVHNARPVLGIVAAPALELIWRGTVATRAERLRLPCGAPPQTAPERLLLRTASHRGDSWRALVSRSHLEPATERWLTRFPRIERLDCGSSIKFCRIAEGKADVYPRLGQTSEWDIAAGDAVLTAAGGVVLTPEGTPLLYGDLQRGLKVPCFVAWCSAQDAAVHSKGSV